MLTYFKQYAQGTSCMTAGLAPTYPADFVSDLQHKLPTVSWLLLGITETEHPG